MGGTYQRYANEKQAFANEWLRRGGKLIISRKFPELINIWGTATAFRWKRVKGGRKDVKGVRGKPHCGKSKFKVDMTQFLLQNIKRYVGQDFFTNCQMKRFKTAVTSTTVRISQCERAIVSRHARQNEIRSGKKQKKIS